MAALAALGTPSARAAVEEARHHSKAEVRDYALRILLEDSDPDREEELETLVIRAVERGNYGMAEHLPTPRVKRALLDCALRAKSEIRVSAAALLLYLCGQAPEPFDWEQRPFFLRFSGNDPRALQTAWEELRQRTGL